jgi:hypothetical protein
MGGCADSGGGCRFQSAIAARKRPDPMRLLCEGFVARITKTKKRFPMTIRNKLAVAAFAALALFALPLGTAQAHPYYRPYYRGYYRPYYGPRIGVGIYVAPRPVIVAPPVVVPAPVIVAPAPVIVRPGY